mgnify:FL=1
MLEHTLAVPQTEGIEIAELVAMLEAGRTREALMRCVAYADLPRSWSQLLGWRLSRGALGSWLGRSRGGRRFAAQVVDRRDVASAYDVLRAYYASGGPLDPALGHYFKHRFCQPRHLAALALAQCISSDGSRAVLDIACGIGHLAHYLAHRRTPAPAVGLDMNFYQLWIARHWMCPTAQFVCADASEGLPFADDSLAACVCSDAYHYIGHRDRLLAEIERCAPARMCVLTRVGNANVMPNEGKEEDLESYRREFNCEDLFIFDEDQLVRCYLEQSDPLSQEPREPSDLARSKWLSFVWHAQRDADRRTHLAEASRPHAVGKLEINPIYECRQTSHGDIELVFRFPGVWFAYENHAMLSYLPRRTMMTKEQLAAVAARPDSPSLRELINSFILLGMPERFGSFPCNPHVAPVS